MFILPLVSILAMVYFGVRSETLGNMLRKRLALAKLGMTVFFAGLGVPVMGTVRENNYDAIIFAARKAGRRCHNELTIICEIGFLFG